MPLPLDVLFTHYLLSGSPEDLLEMCSGILASLHPHSPDTAVAAAHLEEHAAALDARPSAGSDPLGCTTATGRA